jgi:hypothetical protein
VFQELTHDKQTLQEQVNVQLQHIASLKVQVDQLKLGPGTVDDQHVLADELRQKLEVETDAVESKEKEVSHTDGYWLLHV